MRVVCEVMASSLILLTSIFLAEAATGHAAPARQSRWWFGAGSQAHIDQAVELVKAHRKSVTGAYMYIGLHVAADGSFTSPSDEVIRQRTRALLNEGLTVGLAMSFDQGAVQSGRVLQAATAAANTAAHNNITSLMVDYEPNTNITLSHAQAYATAIKGFSEAAHKSGVQLDMCISSWGILEHFSLYQATGVDSMMSMASTYFGKNISSNEMWVEREQEQGLTQTQLRVGIGSTNSVYQKWDYKWTQDGFETFVTWLEQKGVQNVDLWRTDIDTLNATNGTALWIYNRLEAFLAGEHASQSLLV